jgi:hypothetical protein
MLRLLGQVEDADVSKVRTHDAGAEELDPTAIEQPNVCFIDGEHTDRACAIDAAFCRRVLRDKGLIAFHDVLLIHGAVDAFVQDLRNDGVQHSLAYLPDLVFAVEIGPPDLLADPALTGRRLENGAGVLWLLDRYGHYRSILKGRRARVLRRLGLLKADDPGFNRQT